MTTTKELAAQMTRTATNNALQMMSRSVDGELANAARIELNERARQLNGGTEYTLFYSNNGNDVLALCTALINRSLSFRVQRQICDFYSVLVPFVDRESFDQLHDALMLDELTAKFIK